MKVSRNNTEYTSVTDGGGDGCSHEAARSRDSKSR